MVHGVELYNNSGGLSVSSQYRSPGLVAQGTVTTTALGSPWLAPSQFSISYTRASLDEAVFCAIRPGDFAMLIGSSGEGSLTLSWTYYSNQAVGTTVSYYIFSTGASIPTDTYGIEVYDAAGARTFSSAMKPLRLRDSLTTGVSIFGTTDFVYDTSRLYATVLYRWSNVARYVVMSNTSFMSGGGVMGITGGFRAGQVEYVDLPGDETPYDYPNMPVLVLDVTNY